MKAFQMKRLWYRRYSDKIFDVVNIVLMVILTAVFVWPIWFALIASISNPVAVSTGEVLFLPEGITLEGYKEAFKFAELWKGYANTIFISGVGTALNLVLTVCCAYPLSVKEFVPGKVVTYLLLITMYVSGGMIPQYLTVKSVGLLDSTWAMIIPTAISFYNCLIVRNYFKNSIPGELREAATLDGAGTFQYLLKVVLPLSKPVMAVVGLYYLVGHWNDYRSSLLYIYDLDKMPLQSAVRRLLLSTQLLPEDAVDLEGLGEMFVRSEQMKYCVIILAALPVICIYPFIQKFFVKGIMVGSVKG